MRRAAPGQIVESVAAFGLRLCKSTAETILHMHPSGGIRSRIERMLVTSVLIRRPRSATFGPETILDGGVVIDQTCTSSTDFRDTLADPWIVPGRRGANSATHQFRAISRHPGPPPRLRCPPPPSPPLPPSRPLSSAQRGSYDARWGLYVAHTPNILGFGRSRLKTHVRSSRGRLWFWFDLGAGGHEAAFLLAGPA